MLEQAKIGDKFNSLEFIFENKDIRENDDVYQRINGKSYQKNDDISLDDLTYIKMLHYNYDGDVVVGLGNAVADDVCHHKAVGAQSRLNARRVGNLHAVVVDLVAQVNNLHFEQRVARLQVLVDVLEVEVRRNGAYAVVNGRADGVCRCQIDALLIGVCLKQQHTADDHIEDENEP